jgi:molybdate transport system substrate-binding protein
MKRLAAIAAATLLLAATGCGSSSDSGSTTTGTASSAASSGPITVSAASSLQKAFTAYGQKFAGGVRLSFAGSDELAAQIQQGVKPDVFASANTKLPEQLYKAGLVGRPTVFAGNRLVLAVPAKSSKVRSLADLQHSGLKLAIGSASVPIGAYTRKVLAHLPPAERNQILTNVRSEEPDVKGIVGKLSQGAVDAGFVYITDVDASSGALKAIELPKSLDPSAAYGVAVVKGAKHPATAAKFIAGLLHGDGQSALHAAGFEPPPK